MYESGKHASTGRKGKGKGNANFLLNFTVDVPVVWGVTAGGYDSHGYRKRRGGGGGGGGGGGSMRRRPADKDRFVHANFRFVMSPKASLAVLKEPEKQLEWKDMQHIVFGSASSYRCPICLSEPLAPRMTKCGHIYCWSCLVHYAAAIPRAATGRVDRPLIESLYLGFLEVEEKVKKCPLCLQMFALEEVRSVEIVKQKEHSAGGWVELVLVKCDRKVALPAPVALWNSSLSCRGASHASIPRYGSESAVFSRFNTGGDLPGSVAALVLEKERKGIKAALGKAEDDEKPWLELILCQIDVILARIGEMQQEEEERRREEAEAEAQAAAEAAVEASAHSGAMGGVSLGASTGSAVEETQDSSSCLYYYQAVGGERAFLHPLCSRALTEEYGDSSKMPERILGKLLEQEELVVEEETRKRMKFLTHVPLSSSCYLLELDMKPLVSAKSLAPVKAKLDVRRKAREAVVRQKKKEMRKQQQKEKRIQADIKKSQDALLPSAFPTIGDASSENLPDVKQELAGDSDAALAWALAASLEGGAELSRPGDDSDSDDEDEDEEFPAVAPTWVADASSQTLSAQLGSRKHIPVGLARVNASYPRLGGGDSDDDEDEEYRAPDHKHAFLQELKWTDPPPREEEGLATSTDNTGGKKGKKKKGKQKGMLLFGNAPQRNYR